MRFLSRKEWSFDNFAQAMEVTDFWHSLGNSLLIAVATIVLAILIHSVAGYAIAHDMANHKMYRVVYLYIVSGMFVPFAILMMPLVKQTAQMGLGNRLGVILLYVVFYMPMNILLYVGYLKNIPQALDEAAEIDGATTWKTYWSIVFPMMKPMHATVAVLTALGTWNDVMTPLVIMSGTGENTLPLAQAQLPNTVRHKLQLGICLLLAVFDSDFDFLHRMSKTDFERRCQWCRQRIIKSISLTGQIGCMRKRDTGFARC